MPATVTHTFFVNDLYDILPIDIKSVLDTDRLKMFAQSTDSMLFYNLFSLLPGKELRKFQYTFHTKSTQEFFLNLLKYTKDNNINDSDTLSFIVGFISHYALDSTLHPYIYYKTGAFKKNEPNTYKYNGLHLLMETFLDNDMIRRRLKINPYKFDFTNYCFDLRIFSNNLNKTIDYSFFNTYKIKDMGKIYYKSLKQMYYSLKYLRKDKYGIKRFIYKLGDIVTPKGSFRFEGISYHVPLEDNNNYLNNNHSMWRNPTTYDMTSNESFIELYLKALRLSKVLVCASFDYLNDKDIDLEQVFTNISYVTGLNCDDKKELKYFEF